eukprot:TRINITY_DN46640_c0_g1_i1.p1 TRINITY_DN46640_c0_g1~~TRINITY_DN46640_c0_g1_i1.p1  ORF type:complete len:122 (+),score=25.73 TRINITY_DN46640_c0_g1_i1:130-495(+)
MIRRPPRSTQGVSSAASDVYKRQVSTQSTWGYWRDVVYGRKYAVIHWDSKIKGGFEYWLGCDPTVEYRYRVLNIQESPWKLYIDTKYACWEQVFSFYSHTCLLYTSPSPRDLSTSRMPSSA